MNDTLSRNLSISFQDFESNVGEKEIKLDLINSISYFVLKGSSTFGSDSVFIDNIFVEPVSSITHNMPEINNVPNSAVLYQNYPNPFNPNTNISFMLPKKLKVELSIYNILGEKVAELVSGTLNNGFHSYVWEAVNNSSGIYFMRLVDENAVQTRKIVLLK